MSAQAAELEKLKSATLEAQKAAQKASEAAQEAQNRLETIQTQEKAAQSRLEALQQDGGSTTGNRRARDGIQ